MSITCPFLGPAARFTVCAGLALIFGAAMHAGPVVVDELGIGANEVVRISSSTLGNNLSVYAGIIDLTINGVAADAFCIDPWHWSISGPQNYTSEALSSAPKAPGPMSAADALQIGNLWAAYFSPTMTDQQAAGLQIAIWDTVSGTGGATFTLDSSNDYGAAAMIAAVQGRTNPASLLAVTGPGQDYVIANVPERGATAAFLGLGLVGLLLGSHLGNGRRQGAII